MDALHETSKSVYLIDFIQGLPCSFFSSGLPLILIFPFC